MCGGRRNACGHVCTAGIGLCSRNLRTGKQKEKRRLVFVRLPPLGLFMANAARCLMRLPKRSGPMRTQKSGAVTGTAPLSGAP